MRFCFRQFIIPKCCPEEETYVHAAVDTLATNGAQIAEILSRINHFERCDRRKIDDSF